MWGTRVLHILTQRKVLASFLVGLRFAHLAISNSRTTSFRLFVGPQSEKHRLTKQVLLRPLRKLYLRDQDGFEPSRNASSPPA